jgi:hypothetical protein
VWGAPPNRVNFSLFIRRLIRKFAVPSVIGGQPVTIELIFHNDEVIRFDGTDWHHRRG